MSTHTTSTPATGAATDSRGLLRAAAVAAAVALAANLVIWAIATVISDIPDRFTPLQPGSVVFMTILGVGLAAGFYALLRSRVADPAATFRKIVPVAAAVSLIPDLMMWASGAYQGSATAETVLPLMAMHVAAAVACGVLLPKLASRRQSA